MTIFDQINAIPLVDILDKIGVDYLVRGSELELLDEGKHTDGWRANPTKGMVTDFSGKRPQGDRIEFLVRYQNKTKGEVIEWFRSTFGLVDSEKKEFKKQQKRDTFISDMPDHNTLAILRRYLVFRGFSHDQVHTPYVDDLARELGSYEGLFLSEGLHVDTLLFPVYDEEKNRVGVKMRTVDGTTFFEGKSGNVKGGKSGCIYDTLGDTVIIVEGEPDYLILRALGFTSVIGNLGGVASCRQLVKKLCKNAKKIIVAYDNDTAGYNGSIALDFGRLFSIVEYPDGTDGCDLNDLFRRGWSAEDFQKLFETNKEKKEQSTFGGRFIYNRVANHFFDVIGMQKAEPKDMWYATHIGTKMIAEIIASDGIPSYDGLCYRYGGMKNMYNLLDESSILQMGDNPDIHPDIERLLYNLCNSNYENYEWLLEAIYYKYTHPNDSRIPAVLFWGVGSSGKGLFLVLLSTIFGSKNIQYGLGQDDIESQFSSYSGQKLVVEFKELSNNDEAKGKKNIEKLKTIIFEERISVNKKYEQTYEIDNIAWFIMSSNNANALHLDQREKGNRRFSIIHTGDVIHPDEGRRIEETIRDPVIVANFLAYLDKIYPETRDKKYFLALDNEDKKNLEDSNRSTGMEILDWIEEHYPHIRKIRKDGMDYLLTEYEKDTKEHLGFRDARFYKFLLRDWGGRCERRPIDFGGKTERGYLINKKVEGDGIFIYNSPF